VLCYYLDLKNGLHVVGLSEMNNVSINEHANIKDVSCDYLEVKSGAWLTGPISYKYGEEDYVYSLSPLELFVVGEYNSRITLCQKSLCKIFVKEVYLAKPIGCPRPMDP